MILAVSVAMFACVFGLATSMLFNWASGKSALWNIGFFIALVLIAAAVLLLAVTLLSRRLLPSVPEFPALHTQRLTGKITRRSPRTEPTHSSFLS
jgi:hypothetical protein